MNIKKLVQLARIEMGGVEQKEVKKDLESILNYVENLKEVSVDEVPELTHSLDIQNEFRDDRLPDEAYSDQANLVNAAPANKDGFIKVKEVFEDAG